jgi:CHAT domain-containing protein/tetratricopeptide (TPR) repeat protein
MRDTVAAEGEEAMTRIRYSLAVMLALAAGNSHGAAPPVSRGWVEGERQRVEQQDEQIYQVVLVGDFRRALRLTRKVLAARRVLLGERDAQTISTRANLERWARLARLPAPKQRRVGAALRQVAEGNRHRSKGEFVQAEKAFRKALAVSIEVLGEDHPETANGYDNVATCLHDLGKRTEALPLLRKALRIRRKALGEEHLDIANSCNNVAVCLDKLGKGAEALPLYREALRIKSRVFGDDHPEVANGCAHVAHCLRGLGRSSEALPLYRRGLEIHRKVLGGEHPFTAGSYNNVAGCLAELGKASEALPLFRKALRIHRKALGEEHPSTAISYSNVASCLNTLGKASEALPLFRKALRVLARSSGADPLSLAVGYHNLAACLDNLGKRAEALPFYRKVLEITREAFGDDHPYTARGYHGVAVCLEGLGKVSEALPLYRKALLIHRKAFGDDHTDTAACYYGVAFCLHGLEKHSEALPLYRKALLIFRKVHGEDHPRTATCCDNVARCLHNLGKAAEALPLHRKALQITRKIFGDDHPSTATRCSNLASCLRGLGKGQEALPLLRQALAIYRKAYGEDHPHTANGYNNLALCLHGLGKGQEALSLLRKVLEIERKVLGEEHPSLALSYRNIAACLNAQEKHSEALRLYRKGLRISRKTDGEEHPSTAICYNEIAFCLYQMGEREEAIRHLRLALVGVDVGRHSAAAAGFERSLFAATQGEPRILLACLLAAKGKAAEAWRHAEAHLARGLLEALTPTISVGAADKERAAELARLEEQVVPLLGKEKLTGEQEKERDDLLNRRRRLQAEMARDMAARLDKLVWRHEEIQKHLRGDEAVVLWPAAGYEYFACILRQQGEPRWQRLPGSGKGGAWTREDLLLADRVHTAVRQPGARPAEAQRLIEQLRQQRFRPLTKYLKAEGKLPAVRRLVVIPVGVMASVPVELLAEGYTVSYAPSATLFARGVSKHRALRADSLIALGDPVFAPPREKEVNAPAYGLLLRAMLPGGNAARSGLRPGDVLMRYNGVRLRQLTDFKAATAEGERIKASAWREGETFAVRLASGPLGASMDERPIDQALAYWRQSEAIVRGEGTAFSRLPGTRFEVEAIASLVGKDKATLLLGSAASEQKLDRLIRDGRLGKAQVIHLATHGKIEMQRPEHSALVLAADALPDPVEQQRRGRKVYDGFLRVRTILDSWKLDADLVVLSACETGLGKQGKGEGLLGFAQAFLEKGARSVVLSRWKVDDAATALLMLRFYENLLGKRKDLKKPLGRAEALAEAKKWLRSLDRNQAQALVGRLAGGKLRGTIDKALPLVGGKPVKLPQGDRPFAHPTYWAAFVLVGDPE